MDFRYLKEEPDQNVFADISYLTEITDQAPADLVTYASTFRRWIDEFDPHCRHLMFGTDWTMLGLNVAYDGYTTRVYAFFREMCGFDQGKLDRLFFGNAASFLGLREGDATRNRLLKFYDRHNVPRARLPVFTAV